MCSVQLIRYLQIITVTVILLESVLCKVSTPRKLVLGLEVRDWYNADEICKANGQRLLSFVTKDNIKDVEALINLWATDNHLTSSMWIGLTRHQTETQFKWDSCSGKDDNIPWDGGHPSAAPGELCTVINKDTRLLQSTSCQGSYQYICETPQDECWFESFLLKKTTLSTLNMGDKSSNECEKICRTFTLGSQECVLIQLEGSQCLVVMSEKQYIDSIPLMIPATSSYAIIEVKRCLTKSTRDSKMPNNPNSKMPPRVSCFPPAPPVIPVSTSDKTIKDLLQASTVVYNTEPELSFQLVPTYHEQVTFTGDAILTSNPDSSVVSDTVSFFDTSMSMTITEVSSEGSSLERLSSDVTSVGLDTYSGLNLETVSSDILDAETYPGSSSNNLPSTFSRLSIDAVPSYDSDVGAYSRSSLDNLPSSGLDVETFSGSRLDNLPSFVSSAGTYSGSNSDNLSSSYVLDVGTYSGSSLDTVSPSYVLDVGTIVDFKVQYMPSSSTPIMMLSTVLPEQSISATPSTNVQITLPSISPIFFTSSTTVQVTSLPSLPSQEIKPHFNPLCRCICLNKNTTSYGISSTELKEIHKKLFVDKSTLSSTRRKLTSAEDLRPSAIITGKLGLVVLVGVFCFLLLLDLQRVIVTVFQFLKEKLKLCNQ